MKKNFYSPVLLMPIEKEKKSEFDEVRVVHSCEEMMQLEKEE